MQWREDRWSSQARLVHGKDRVRSAPPALSPPNGLSSPGSWREHQPCRCHMHPASLGSVDVCSLFPTFVIYARDWYWYWDTDFGFDLPLWCCVWSLCHCSEGVTGNSVAVISVCPWKTAASPSPAWATDLLSYVFNIVDALPWHFSLSLIAFCQFLALATHGRRRCCKDISELYPLSAMNPHFPCSSLYCWCSGRNSCCLSYSLQVWTPAGLWLSQHYPCVPVWYLCVHPFLALPAILPFCTGAPSRVSCLPNWSPEASCFSEWLHILVLYLDLLKDLLVLLCCLSLLEVSPMGAHLVTWELLLSCSWDSRLIWTRCLLVPFFLHSGSQTPLLRGHHIHWLPQLHLFSFHTNSGYFGFFFPYGILRECRHDHSAPDERWFLHIQWQLLSCTSRRHKQKASIQQQCPGIPACTWHEQKVTFSIASVHCSLSSVEIPLITRGCAVGFDL